MLIFSDSEFTEKPENQISDETEQAYAGTIIGFSLTHL